MYDNSDAAFSDQHYLIGAQQKKLLWRSIALMIVLITNFNNGASFA